MGNSESKTQILQKNMGGMCTGISMYILVGKCFAMY